jgi:hypothetical protein
MTQRKWLLWFSVACFVVVLSPMTMAQSQYISGTVVDQSGAIVRGAQVTIEDEAKKGVVREVTTGENGRFQALNLQPGPYLITVETAGFKKAQNRVVLDVNTRLDVGQIVMEVGEMTQEVAVTEVRSLVEANTMEKAYLVDQRQILELPMNGRQWKALMATIPGVTTDQRSDFFDNNFNVTSGFHVGGDRGSQNNFYLDGSPNLEVGNNLCQYTQPSIDTIAEFKVQMSSFDAEYGRNSGMVVAVETKSGTQKFHGTAYEFLRNDAFDACNAVLSSNCSGLKDTLRYNQFGGNLGGWLPIPKVSTKDKKRIFFFYNREMTRQIDSTAGQHFYDVPSLDILNGDFRPWLTDVPMDYAPQFKVGTVFMPGTIKRDGQGNIIDGTPFPNNNVPQNLWVGNSANLLKLFTGIPNLSELPDTPGAAGYKRYYFVSPYEYDKDQDLARVDYLINDSTTTYFRWVNDDMREQDPMGIWAWQPFPMMPQKRPKPGSSWSWNTIKTFSPTFSSETILAYMHETQSIDPVDSSAVSRSTLGVNYNQLFPASNFLGIIPDFYAGPLFGNFGAPGWHNDGEDYSLTENLSWVKKSHTMKFGFHYNRDNKKQTATWGQQGSMYFDSGPGMPNDTGTAIANLMLGNFNNYSQISRHVYPYFRFQSWEWFAQDNWKINRKLTLEFGLRFQKSTPTYTYTRNGTEGGEGTFPTLSVDTGRYSASRAPQIDLTNGLIIGDPMVLLNNGVIEDPSPGVPRGFSPTVNRFAPRLGFAYDLTGDGKTSFRGGFGVYYERLCQYIFNFVAGGNFPNLITATVYNGNAGNIDTNFETPPVAPPGYKTWDPANVIPAIYSWKLGVQRELHPGWVLDLSYVGNRDTHLMIVRSTNGLPIGTYLKYPDLLASVNGFDAALRPYQGFGSLSNVETTGYSMYNGMLVRLSRRFANGLSFNVNYTWSRAFNLTDSDASPINNPFDLRQDWAPAGFDRTHVLTLDYVYQLPKVKGVLNNMIGRAILNGWELAGITRFETGLPTTVTSNGNLYGLDVGWDWGNSADLAGDATAGQSSSVWFNRDAFRRPPDGQWGNLHRNSLRLPGTNNWDMNISKFFTLHEQVKLNVPFEAFNLFNHTQIWNVNTGFSSDNQGGPISATNTGFGYPTEFRDPRILQFGFKLTF